MKSAETIIEKLKPALTRASKYSTFILVVTFLSVYVYLVQFIGGLIQSDSVAPVSDSQIKPISRLKIDQNAVNQINELEAQNIEVRSLLDEARQNPFSE